MAMADYLISKDADYVAEELAITPQQTLEDTAEKTQKTFQADNGWMNVTSFGTETYFTVSLQWEILTLKETQFIESLWASPNKANGSERTFYWVHPSDGYTYVARFMSPIKRTQKGNMCNYRSISSVSLRLEGVKP